MKAELIVQERTGAYPVKMKNKFQVIAILALLPLLSYAQGGRNFDAVQVEVKKVQGSN